MGVMDIGLYEFIPGKEFFISNWSGFRYCKAIRGKLSQLLILKRERTRLRIIIP